MKSEKIYFMLIKKGNVSIKELDKNAKTKNLIERIENGKGY